GEPDPLHSALLATGHSATEGPRLLAEEPVEIRVLRRQGTSIREIARNALDVTQLVRLYLSEGAAALPALGASRQTRSLLRLDRRAAGVPARPSREYLLLLRRCSVRGSLRGAPQFQCPRRPCSACVRDGQEYFTDRTIHGGLDRNRLIAARWSWCCSE